jgi:polyvinyl alcohol dehydrogenase (cytochrome)
MMRRSITMRACAVRWILAIACLSAVVLALAPSGASASLGSLASWRSVGHGLSDDWDQPLEFKINPVNVFRLKPAWVFITHGSVSATPAVYDGVVYFPDFGGYMNAVNAATGALIWQEPISAYDGVSGSYSRDSPTIYDNELIFGDVLPGVHPAGAHVFAVNPATGALIWSAEVDSHPAAIVTGSPVVADGMVIVGVSSNEETDAESTSYPCCTFRGSVVALNATNGDMIWQTYTVPSNGGVPCTSDNPPTGCGYSGGAVWDNPAVDLATDQIFIGSGNNYTTPDAAAACAQLADENHTSDADCTAPDDYFDSELALNLQTGAIEWSYKSEGWDAYTLGCLGQTAGTNWCPDPKGPDWDFSSGPNLMTIPAAGGGSETVVGAGQKSGIYWEFDPATGDELWHQQVGPGTTLGGVMWGTAFDGKRIYVHESDPTLQPYTFANGDSVTGGSWGALNPTTGAFEWQTATPFDGVAMGPTTVANGVMYAGSMDPTGSNMFALDAATGKILWRYSSGGSVNSAPAIVNGTVYWGSGYGELSSLGYTDNDELYAFTIGGTSPSAGPTELRSRDRQ